MQSKITCGISGSFTVWLRPTFPIYLIIICLYKPSDPAKRVLIIPHTLYVHLNPSCSFCLYQFPCLVCFPPFLLPVLSPILFLQDCKTLNFIYSPKFSLQTQQSAGSLPLWTIGPTILLVINLSTPLPQL